MNEKKRKLTWVWDDYNTKFTPERERKIINVLCTFDLYVDRGQIWVGSPLPWDKGARYGNLFWNNSDDACLRYLLEVEHGIENPRYRSCYQNAWLAFIANGKTEKEMTKVWIGYRNYTY